MPSLLKVIYCTFLHKGKKNRSCLVWIQIFFPLLLCHLDFKLPLVCVSCQFFCSFKELSLLLLQLYHFFISFYLIPWLGWMSWWLLLSCQIWSRRCQVVPFSFEVKIVVNLSLVGWILPSLSYVWVVFCCICKCSLFLAEYGLPIQLGLLNKS